MNDVAEETNFLKSLNNVLGFEIDLNPNTGVLKITRQFDPCLEAEIQKVAGGWTFIIIDKSSRILITNFKFEESMSFNSILSEITNRMLRESCLRAKENLKKEVQFLIDKI